jgi:hypothetical protein
MRRLSIQFGSGKSPPNPAIRIRKSGRVAHQAASSFP